MIAATFDTDVADILASAAVGWTDDTQCRLACFALDTGAGLDRLRDRLVSAGLMTPERAAIIDARRQKLAVRT